ncbi:MAG: ribosome maturation factor RimP [Eubacteriales bacterium]|nr:ribosome maturation factor RimP [Eubacteriales bacterium]
MNKKSSKPSRRAGCEEAVEAMLSPIAASLGVRIYDVEYVKEGSDYYLRAYIDKEGGVTIGDCEAVSRALSEELDREDPIQDAYILEVSSPGLGRNLTKDRHLQYSLGEEVEGKLFKPLVPKGPKEFEGILRAFDADTVSVETPEGETIVLDRKNIAVLRLALDF